MQTDTILELQQKIGLKEQLLQRKMEALTEAVEKREAQLYSVLSAANLDPTMASDTTKKLQVPIVVWLTVLPTKDTNLQVFLILGHFGLRRCHH